MIEFIYACGTFILLYLMMVGATKIYTKGELAALVAFSLTSWFGILIVILMVIVKKYKRKR